ncbi:hypothetical protein CWRG_01350 [Chthonomonas calidirosea]|uniref:hypothetical protein n=1 Tax=Chthonomonas calidirosea TaxID=454171 RepID=UPI0006DD48F1|nr:hypothetical protein [Chthonomonas calidirosea]CEK16022.1 hypothetical protein CWRG_01350 [Chthonomonas calidirosea]
MRSIFRFLLFVPIIFVGCIAGYAQIGPAPAVELEAPFTLQGDASSLTLSANNADVREVLHALFLQAHRQYVPDATVMGRVTLLLIHQPFHVVLDSVCRQAFLAYRVDEHGIYHVYQDEAALRQTFARIKLLNGLTAQQLNNYLRSQSPNPADVPTAPLHSLTPQPLLPNVMTKTLPKLPASPSQDLMQSEAQFQKAWQQYQAFQRRSALLSDEYAMVRMNVPDGKPIPVAEVLRDFSEQSGVPIYVDPIIAQDSNFRIDGTLISPLPEALNLIGLVAHLSVYKVNSAYFVTTAPDFRIFYGDTSKPKASYPPSASGR